MKKGPNGPFFLLRNYGSNTRVYGLVCPDACHDPADNVVHILLGPNSWLLLAYRILFSIGEAFWQPGFLQYAAEPAPEGQSGPCIAFANMPWFMIKFIAGWYTGRMMDIYCPAEGPLNTETMWLIYGLVAMISPVALVLAGRWVSRGLQKIWALHKVRMLRGA